jgi:hypothetical protein
MPACTPTAAANGRPSTRKPHGPNSSPFFAACSKARPPPTACASRCGRTATPSPPYGKKPNGRSPARWRSLHLPGSGALATQQSSASGNVTSGTRSRAAAFTWSAPEDTELTGPMSARLWVQLSGCDDANLFVGIEKWRHAKYVGFEGSYGYGRDRVSAGWQRVSLRAPDPRSPSPGNRSRPAPSRSPSAPRRWWRSMSRWARRRPCSARASSCG